MAQPVPSSLRLDIWLWRTRLFKTRGLAGRVIDKGRVRITRFGQTERTRKPHFSLQIGDIVTLPLGDRVMTLEVMGLGTRRGPAKEAQSLYLDMTQNSHAEDVTSNPAATS